MSAERLMILLAVGLWAGCAGNEPSTGSNAGSAAALARPNFVGRWTLDPNATQTAGGGRGDASGNASGGGGRGGGGAGLGPPAEELTDHIHFENDQRAGQRHHDGVSGTAIPLVRWQHGRGDHGFRRQRRPQGGLP